MENLWTTIMTPIPLDLKRTALVLIDLQQGIVGRSLAPRSGSDVIQNAARLADRFRVLGATVVLVRVAFHPDFKDRLNVPSDLPMPVNASALPLNWAEIVPEIGPRPGDIVVTKRQWGAFHGTELDLQLRRRDVRTIVLGGISTNIGVESTARSAYEHGYAQVFVEDAMASHDAEAHNFAIKNIFPRVGQVRSAEVVLSSLAD
jgi:nicotinamidase-related amidase